MAKKQLKQAEKEDFGLPGKTMHVRYEHQLAVMEPLLIELVCDGCMESQFKHIVGTAVGLMVDLDVTPQLHQWDTRHVGPVFSSKKAEKIGIPSGYSFCGTYHAVRVWRQVPPIEGTNG